MVLLAVSGSAALEQSSGQGAAALTVIRAGTLIDGVSAAPRKNQLIFVRGKRIEKLTDGSAAIPSGSHVIDLSNATVLPGLIDAHTHIFLWGEDPSKGGYDANILKAGIALRAARATYAARRALEQGFTTLRDVETEGAADTTWKATRRNWRCPRALSSSMGPWKRARPRASNSSTERTGSRST